MFSSPSLIIRAKAVVGAALAAAFALTAQPVHPAFEVVSIRPLGEARRARSGLVRSDPAHVSLQSVTIRSLAMRAYDVRNYQVEGPPWIDELFYDVEAKIPEGAPQSQVPAMLQGLLAERFGMKIHRESPIQSVYVLLVGKSGSKLKKSDEAPLPNSPRGTPVSSSFTFSASGNFELAKSTMAQFARMLSSFT